MSCIKMIGNVDCHTETNNLIWSWNQMTAFYMTWTIDWNGLWVHLMLKLQDSNVFEKHSYSIRKYMN